MTIAIGADHAGVQLKQVVIGHLAEMGLESEDFGTHDEKACDYPDIAEAVARAVAGGEYELGVLICGSGVGMSMSANKVRGAYAALCCHQYAAETARAHTGANILCVGARIVGTELAKAIVTTFVRTPVSGEERHVRRRTKVERLTAGNGQ